MIRIASTDIYLKAVLMLRFDFRVSFESVIARQLAR